MTWFRLGGCSKCRGDLAYDDGDWACMQCGTYFYTGLYQTDLDRQDHTPERQDSSRPAAGLLAWLAEREIGGVSPAQVEAPQVETPQVEAL